MASKMKPLNFEIANVTRSSVAHLRPTTSINIMQGASQELDEDGLFSVKTFGRVGDEMRDERFSFIDCKVKIFHPNIYQSIVKLKALYEEIIKGKRYAIWDEGESDFLPSDELEGSTGYAFFVKHWKKIKFKRTDSFDRNQRIDKIEMYKDIAMSNLILILPAGLRDVEIKGDNRIDEDEINKLYRRCISITNTITVTDEAMNSPIHDNSRVSLQNTFNEIYAMLYGILEGKGGFFQKKWGSRRIFNGTRNVLTSMDHSATVFGAPNAPKLNNCVMGLYQTMRGLLPVAQHHILRNTEKYFMGVEGKANLVNKKTLKREVVSISTDYVDLWTTAEGANRLINIYDNVEMRQRPIEIGDHYLGLIYTSADGKYFRHVDDIVDVPDHIDRKRVRPITLIEFLYLSNYREWGRYPAFLTRYPVEGDGSDYPAFIYVKTTIEGEMREELDENWEPMGEGNIALEYPKHLMESFMDSLAVHTTRIARSGADYDGDTSSADIAYSEDVVEETQRKMSSRMFYVDNKNKFRASTAIQTNEFTFRSLTGEYRETT